MSEKWFCDALYLFFKFDFVRSFWRIRMYQYTAKGLGILLKAIWQHSSDPLFLGAKWIFLPHSEGLYPIEWKYDIGEGIFKGVILFRTKFFQVIIFIFTVTIILQLRLFHMFEHKIIVCFSTMLLKKVILNNKSQSSVWWYYKTEKRKWIKFTQYIFKQIKIDNSIDFW